MPRLHAAVGGLVERFKQVASRYVVLFRWKRCEVIRVEFASGVVRYHMSIKRPWWAFWRKRFVELELTHKRDQENLRCAF